MGHTLGCMASMQVFPMKSHKAPYGPGGGEGLAENAIRSILWRSRQPGGGGVGESSTSGTLQSTAIQSGSLEELKSTIKVPLTEREVFTITKSWKAISSNMTHTGIAMFLRYFTIVIVVFGLMYTSNITDIIENLILRVYWYCGMRTILGQTDEPNAPLHIVTSHISVYRYIVRYYGL